jgi:RNA polymerase sigma factor (sigma-70 family)
MPMVCVDSGRFDGGGTVDDLDLLVDAARAGGGWAFGRLWELLAPVVAVYLRRRGVRDVDDVTSEVFLAAFRGIGRLDGDGAAFRAWLFTIAHHKAVDAVRRPVRELPLDLGGELSPDRGAWPSAEDEALDRVGGSAALRALQLLTPDQREVLLLRVVGDLSLAETAQVLGKPVGAVKALQHRALARLRTAVSPDPRAAMWRVT